MPPLPVIANTYRCAIVGGTSIGITPVNVIHVEGDGTNEAEVGDNLWDAMQSVGYQFGCVPYGFGASQIQVLPLDGTSATVTVPRPSSYEVVDHYTDAGQAIPESAGIVSLRTSARGPSGRGRVFLGPAAEGAVQDGFLNASVREAIQIAWDLFVVNLFSDADLILGVASYVDAVFRPVERMVVQSGLGTQRRRLLQQR